MDLTSFRMTVMIFKTRVIVHTLVDDNDSFRFLLVYHRIFNTVTVEMVCLITLVH